jgi:hypothetical protein
VVHGALVGQAEAQMLVGRQAEQACNGQPFALATAGRGEPPGRRPKQSDALLPPSGALEATRAKNLVVVMSEQEEDVARLWWGAHGVRF